MGKYCRWLRFETSYSCIPMYHDFCFLGPTGLWPFYPLSARCDAELESAQHGAAMVLNTRAVLRQEHVH